MANRDILTGRAVSELAFKRLSAAFNYGVECGVIPKGMGSPLKGFKVPRPIPRNLPYAGAGGRDVKVTNPAFATR